MITFPAWAIRYLPTVPLELARPFSKPGQAEFSSRRGVSIEYPASATTRLELIRQAVAGALPYGFTVTTDPQYLGTNDYRWDRSSDSVAVWIWTYDNDDGTTDYHIQIAHFLS